MKIKKMTATFGKLKNSTLELEPGLNIIEAPNEYGKSTWCAFIKSMLYGISTSERDRNGHISAKNRYRPWDGGATSGTMEIEHGGRDITLQRTNHGSAPMKNLLAAYTGTAEFIRDLTGDNVGEKLTGVSEHVFERTAFIRRPELRVSQTSDLERRISSIVFSGDEQVSYSESDSQLRAWQRKLRYNRSGSIPALEAELREAEGELERLTESADELAELRSTIARLEKQKESLENDLLIHDKLERRAASRRLGEAEVTMRRCEERVRQLNEALTKNGHRITREDINDIRETASSINPLRRVRNEAEKVLWQAEKDLNDVVSKKAASPLSGKTEEEALALSRRAAELQEQAEKAKTKKMPSWLPFTLICLGVVLSLISSGLLVQFGIWIKPLEGFFNFRFYILIPALAIFGGGLYLMLKKPTVGKAGLEFEAMLKEYGVTSAEKLSSLVSVYTGLCRSEEPAAAARDAARQSYDAAAAELDAASQRAAEQLAAFMPDVQSGEDVMVSLINAEETLDKLTRAEFDMVSAQNIYETLAAEFDPESEPDDEYIPMPLRDRDDTKAALERAVQGLTEAVRSFDIATGAWRTLGDPAVIEGKIEDLRERIAAQTKQYDALSLAIDVLDGANTELQTRFSPLISKRAGEIMNRISLGRYDKLNFDKGFDATARAEDDSVSRSVLTLSDGTADEIYLSLRLAMCELVLDGEEPCPIILDDALLNFDDRRCRAALEFLLEISETRQVILFSCHEREGNMMRGTAANIIGRL